MANLIEKNCDLCNADAKNSTVVVVENNYPIVKCNQCGFIYVNQQPREEGGKVIDEYYEGSNEEVEKTYEGYKKVNAFLFDEINKKFPNQGRFLDVGCGYGYLLTNMMNHGWMAFGSELSELAVKHVNKKYGKECVFYGDLPDIPFEKHTFDAINMTNVLEHVPYPTKTLLRCKELLNKEGLLYIRVPNMDFSFPFDKIYKIMNFFGIKFSSYSIISMTPPSHLNGFNSRTITKMLEKTGYEVLEIKPSTLRGNKFYGTIEFLSKIVFTITFKQVNICPTFLAIARIKNSQ
jgi:2-polyprenyl-3-methyl-5-hydroxy-6-metoxy-1,4-benzoquinol methylase